MPRAIARRSGEAPTPAAIAGPRGPTGVAGGGTFPGGCGTGGRRMFGVLPAARGRGGGGGSAAAGAVRFPFPLENGGAFLPPNGAPGGIARVRAISGRAVLAH